MFFRIGFLVIFAALLSINVADAQSCRPGYGHCPRHDWNKCSPLGSTCCDNNQYCPGDSICVPGGCLKKTSKRVCANGQYCDEDHLCITGNKCLSVKSYRVCSNLSYCPQGSICTNEGGCLSETSNRYCGGGKYCSEGYKCAIGGGCEPIATFGPPAPSRTQPGNPPISDACLVVEQSVRIGGSIGECEMEGGLKDHYYMTNIHSSNAPGCPKEIEFSLTDPGNGESETWYTPFKAQTCGGPPTNVHVVD